MNIITERDPTQIVKMICEAEGVNQEEVSWTLPLIQKALELAEVEIKDTGKPFAVRIALSEDRNSLKVQFGETEPLYVAKTPTN